MSSINLEFIEWVRRVNKHLQKTSGFKEESAVDKEREVFARMVKLNEECGELSEAVLSRYGYQRKDKPIIPHEALEDELSDVLLVVLGIALYLDCDINSAVERKCKKIADRYDVSYNIN